MARIVVKPIPRKKFNVRVGGKLFKLTLNKRNYNASMPNHYPNTRVGLLENRVKTLEDNPPPTIDIDDQVTEGSPNAVSSAGIWAALQSLLQSFQNLLGLHVNADNDAHPATAIEHKDSTVAERLDNITAGSIARDVDGNITSITTFGEATIINRNGEGIITGWENDTHIWTLTKTGDTITGWTVAEKE